MRVLTHPYTMGGEEGNFLPAPDLRVEGRGMISIWRGMLDYYQSKEASSGVVVSSILPGDAF